MISKNISHYKIIEKLGTGGMGVVYKAEDLKLKRMVALKFLPANLTSDEEAKTRFIHEAQAASALDHPNICTIYEIDETDDGQMFIAMACYEGESLKEKIKRGSLQLQEAINIALQIGQGLEKAHSKEIIHRDVKPANIFVTDDHVVKIVDFGLAKLVGQTSITKTGSTIGTVAYMSPEQARGEDVDQRTDIWSLAVVLYEMVTGKLPFHGEYEQAILYQIMNVDPESLTGLRPIAPKALERITHKALAKNRESRYRDVHEMLKELKVIEKEVEGADLDQVTVKPAKPSIAVLPFVDMSAEKDQEYFCDGMAEEIISTLTQLENLRVIARTSAFAFKGKQEDTREIGRKLNVETLLEGSVRKGGNRVRITAQLINVSDGSHIWAKNYDKDLEDILLVQSEIAQVITEEIKVKITPAEQKRMSKAKQVNPQAYEMYLKGRHFYNRVTEANLQKSIEFFNKAIEMSPDYALAYAGLSDSYTNLVIFEWISIEKGWPIVKQEAEKALMLDNDLAEAYTRLGSLNMYYEWNWQEAERNFKRAIELKPGSADAQYYYGSYLTTRGWNHKERAISEMKRAIELDPLSIFYKMEYGAILLFFREYHQAIEQLQYALELDPNDQYTHWCLGWVYLEMEMYDQAIKEIEKAPDLLRSPMFSKLLASTYARSGNIDKAMEILDGMLHPKAGQQVSAVSVAHVYSAFDQKDEAFTWLNKAYEERSPLLLFLNIAPEWDNLRSDPRFTEILKKMGLEP